MITRTYKYKDISWLCLLAIIVHLLVFFNNGVFWDGVLSYGFYQTHNTHAMRLLALSMGEPFYYYVYRALWALGFGTVVNLLGFFSILLSGIFCYKTVKLYKSIPSSLALLVGTFVIIFPGSLLTFYRAIVSYYVCYFLFYLACYLGIKYERDGSIWCRLASLPLFFLSFSLKSLICFYLVFYIAMYLMHVEKHKAQIFDLRVIARFLMTRFDFLILSISFWFVTTYYFERIGTYSDYNTIQFGGAKWFLHYLVKSFKISVFKHIRYPLILIFFGGIACLVMRGVPKLTFSQIKQRLEKRKVYLLLMGMGVMAFLLAVIPYILVHKPPIYSFVPSTRYAMLVPLSTGLFLAGFVGFVFLDKKGNITRGGKWFLLPFVLYCLAYWWMVYMHMQVESAMQKSFIMQMKERPEWKEYSTYWVKMKKFHKTQPEYASYGWAWLLQQSYGGLSRIAYWDQTEEPENYRQVKAQMSSKEYQMFYNVPNLNVEGCQAILTIGPGHHGVNTFVLGTKYLYYRILDREHLSNYLGTLLSLNVKSYFSSEAKDCL